MKKARPTESETAETEADVLRAALDEVGRDRPLTASGNELILLEIDPHRAHVCWNIDPDQAETGRPLVLRVFDITGSGNPGEASQAFDVEVTGLQGRWYLDLWRDDRTFVTQLGYRQPDGSLQVLAQSNEVSTPPAEPQPEPRGGGHVDPHGKPLHTEWPGDRMAPESETASAGSPSLDTPPAAPEHTADAPEPEPLVVEPVTLLEPEFPRAYWPVFNVAEAKAPPAVEQEEEPVGADPMPSVPVIAAAGETSVAFDDEEMEGTPSGFPAAEQLLASVQENRGAIDAFYKALETDAGASGSYAAEAAGPAPESPSTPAGDAGRAEAPAWTPAPLEQVLGLSSLEHPGRDVLLEVNAELHIYGRSKPDTELTLYGQVVKTRPDGSFSVRRPLPHGAVILPLLYTKKGEGKAEG